MDPSNTLGPHEGGVSHLEKRSWVIKCARCSSTYNGRFRVNKVKQNMGKPQRLQAFRGKNTYFHIYEALVASFPFSMEFLEM